MYSRSNHFWVTLLAAAAVWATLMGARVVRAANTPPIAEAWNITSSGKAESSGELLFRVTEGPGDSPKEVTVFVLSGTNETGVASSIRRALTTQLDRNRFNVEAGEGANVLLSGERDNQGFSVELVDSDVENVRVSVQSAAPVAPPTVPPQRAPANPPALPSTPPAPGDVVPPSDAAPAPVQAPPSGPAIPTPSAPPATPSAPPAEPTPPLATPSSPPADAASPPAAPEAPAAPPDEASPANGGAGAPASAPPPPPGTH
jgi:hypothetical protein